MRPPFPRERNCFVAFIILCSALFISHPLSGQLQQQSAKLVSTPADEYRFGTSVAISADGNTAIVGANSVAFIGYEGSPLGGAGGAWVWTRNGGVWTQQGNKLTASDASFEALQGSSVSLSADGNTAIVGGWGDSRGTGAAWIWTRSGETWMQQSTKLVGSGGAGQWAEQGTSVSLSADGNTAITGGPGAGAAWVWTRSGGAWSEQAKLIGSSTLSRLGQGNAVALSGDGNTAIVGGFGDNDYTGAAWIFTRIGANWMQQAKLVGSDATIKNYQGLSVALSADGNTAIVAGNDNAFWVWTRISAVWTQQGNKLLQSGPAGPRLRILSLSLSADGDAALVGGQTDSGEGAARLWTRSGGVWSWSQYPIKPTGEAPPGYNSGGYAVSLSAHAKTAIIGSPSDHSDAGAAWIFSEYQPPPARRRPSPPP